MITRFGVCCRRIALVAVSLLGTACATLECVTVDTTGTQTAVRESRDDAGRELLPHLLYVPAAQRDDCRRRWPLLMFLHGSGERGSDIELVKTHGPPKLLAQGQALPFIVVSPQLPAEARWEAPQLLALLDHILARLPVDQARVYLTGLSLGGHGVWEIGAEAPGRFAALAPVCGKGDVASACHLQRMPLWAFHGADDTVVPLAAQQHMVDAVRACGGAAQLTVYPDVGHDSWNRAYADPELYRWLLAQRRQSE